MARWLVLGAGGNLGCALVGALSGEQIFTASRFDLWPLAANKICELVQRVRPDFVVNCAADTDVEGAESDLETSYAVNALLPRLVAAACRQSAALLIHISSVGCYGTAKLIEPYIEDDPLVPTTVHHKSKASGEAEVHRSGAEHLILRTGWLFGGSPSQPKNFVWKRLIEATANPILQSDASQIGNPTFVEDAARHIRMLAETHLTGTYNLVSSGVVTRAEFVKRIVELAGLSCDVIPVRTGFPRKARVSPNESAVNFRLDQLAMNQMTGWEDPLNRYIEVLRESREWRRVSDNS